SLLDSRALFLNIHFDLTCFTACVQKLIMGSGRQQANVPTFELEHLPAFFSLSDEPKFSLQFDLRRGTANEDVEVSRVGVPVVVLHAEIRERRSSFTDMRLLSPGFKFTLAKPFSSLAGRGTLE